MEGDEQEDQKVGAYETYLWDGVAPCLTAFFESCMRSTRMELVGESDLMTVSEIAAMLVAFTNSRPRPSAAREARVQQFLETACNIHSETPQQLSDVGCVLIAQSVTNGSSMRVTGGRQRGFTNRGSGWGGKLHL